MAICIRTDDTRTTTLFTGQCVSKAHPYVEAYGTLDEPNVAPGLCICAVKSPRHRQLLENIQLQLFWFSVELANKNGEPTPEQRCIGSKEITVLEAAIDTAMGRMSPLCSFILPGRSGAASRLHFVRTLAHRAERRLVEPSTEISVGHVLMYYINYLSGCLYALARTEDHDAHQDDIIQKVTERYPATVQASATKEPTMSLFFQGLHQFTHATATRAEELQVPIAISIVGASGTQMVTRRISDALLVSSELALRKVWTAVAMKTATHELTSTAQPGATLYGLESHMQEEVAIFDGGYTLWCEGLFLGGLGTSRGSAEQGMGIAETAIAAVNMRTHQ